MPNGSFCGIHRHTQDDLVCPQLQLSTLRIVKFTQWRTLASIGEQNMSEVCQAGVRSGMFDRAPSLSGESPAGRQALPPVRSRYDTAWQGRGTHFGVVGTRTRNPLLGVKPGKTLLGGSNRAE
jgi:hypothetical protein